MARAFVKLPKTDGVQPLYIMARVLAKLPKTDGVEEANVAV